jgi:hypothetical protein
MSELIYSNYSKETFPELLTLSFGMTKTEVKIIYNKKSLRPLFERADRLDFISPPVDVPQAAEINLIFKDDWLVAIYQYFEVVKDDASAFAHIAKYRDLKDQLVAKYGLPEALEFMDDQFNNSKSRLKGFKLKKGNYASIWRNIKGMDVFLVLGGDGFDTFIRLTYKQRSDS